MQPSFWRHRAFLARLRGVRAMRMRAPPVARVLALRSNRAFVHRSFIQHLTLHNIRNSYHASPLLREILRREIHTVALKAMNTRTVEQRDTFHTSEVERQVARPSDIASRPPAASSSTSTIVHHVPRLTMTVAKPAGAARDPSVESRSAPASRIDDIARARGDVTRSAERTSMTLPPTELSRLTDHVMQQLDRRVLSYRERTGRL